MGYKMNDYILEMRNITKTFPGVLALDDVSLKVKKGEVHALIGENGAGKSTLMKILNGVYQANKGDIFLNGVETRIKDTTDAKQKGIGLVFQEFNLVDSLSVSENIFMNRLKKTKGRIDWKGIDKEAQKLLDGYEFNFSATEKVENLSAAQKQLVEIAKVLSYNAKIVVMDEPTSSLTSNETEILFGIIEKLKKESVSIIFISHKLEEVFRLCDTTTVLRDGKVIDTKNTKDFSRDEIIEKMVGRSVSAEYPKKQCEIGETILKVEGLTRKGIVNDISFELHRGEILGFAGLVGSGRTETAEAIFGAEKMDSGNIWINGKKTEIHSTSQGKSEGIGLLTEDRKETGLVLNYDLVKNISITNLEKIKKRRFLSKKKETEQTTALSVELNVKTPSMKQLAMNLSGGNQQKVVFAKWLFSDVEILILDEPTRGIDVGAKYEIYQLMNKLAESGKAIIMISSELPEVLGMSDRVVVLSGGEKVGELSKFEATPAAVMALAVKN
ncbi:MAG: sugar ABC transporter ATP-binding protein [Candidatus Cloacimonetes bacterium]|nr:sugar ABC transporter ATP-binding protein [Candidatus Cloacimonadota bacterium]